MKTKGMVKKIWLQSEDFVSPKEHQHLVMINEFHGDHDLNWVLLIDDKTNKEIERYNARFLAIIEWL